MVSLRQLSTKTKALSSKIIKGANLLTIKWKSCQISVVRKEINFAPNKGIFSRFRTVSLAAGT